MTTKTMTPVTVHLDPFPPPGVAAVLIPAPVGEVNALGRYGPLVGVLLEPTLGQFEDLGAATRALYHADLEGVIADWEAGEPRAAWLRLSAQAEELSTELADLAVRLARLSERREAALADGNGIAVEAVESEQRKTAERRATLADRHQVVTRLLADAADAQRRDLAERAAAKVLELRERLEAQVAAAEAKARAAAAEAVAALYPLTTALAYLSGERQVIEEVVSFALRPR